MMYRLFLFLLVMIVSTTSFAQGVEMGLNIGFTGYTTTDSRTNYYNTSASYDVDVGLTFNIPISAKSIYIQPELNFTRRSASTSIGSINHVKAYSENLEIPLLLCFHRTTSNEKMSFYEGIGPGLTIVYKQKLIEPPSSNLPPTQRTSYSWGDIYKVGVVAEIGVRWDWSEKSAFTIGLRGSYDIKAMTKSNDIPDFKFRNSTIKVGYIIKF